MNTHEVLNQTPPFRNIDLTTIDRPLRDALKANGVDGDSEDFQAFGQEWGEGDRLDLGRLANENPPVLERYDASGHRRDIVVFHPAYHALMRDSMKVGLHNATWNGGSATARAARLFVISGVEAGHVCPLTMTHASVAALSASPERLAEWLPRIGSGTYDPRFIPFWDKSAVTLGMGMTEKQGGTDVRANTTHAACLAGDEYALTGHKWFLSAPMCDAFLVLAQAKAGLTCFLLPRFRPDGSVNGLRLERLKDKLGNRSNASGEVEFAQAFAWRIGEEGRGIATILQMVQWTRLDCAVSSAGLVRMALALACHHARHRSVFGEALMKAPLMRQVLADLALESEAMTALAMRLARAFDNPAEAAFARLITPAVKFGICKRAPGLIYELMECLGGNGYVEESPLPRLYREAPVNAIWEGSGNVMALDILRIHRRDRPGFESVMATLADDTRALPRAKETIDTLLRTLESPEAESRGRSIADALYRLAVASALAASAPAEIVDVWARTRLLSPSSVVGASDLGTAETLLLDRAFEPI